MRYLALATDYDGTLAHDGRVDAPTLDALKRFLASGRKLILVTGRELDELLATFPEIHLFERVVAENGALLYQPSDRQERTLALPPPPGFVAALKQRGVGPISVGRVIVATWEPHQGTVLEVIREQGLELQVIFNKGAVMVLPAGVNKASGLAAVLEELGLSPHNVIGVGDAENDHAFLQTCECAVAVANALPAVKKAADLTTRADRGAGVTELIDEVLADDLAGRNDQFRRHPVLIGTRPDDTPVYLPPIGSNLLVVGPSGSGKSTLTTGLVERLMEQHYQVCLIDPEGDYESMEGAIVLGSSKQGPTVEEVLHVLHSPKSNLVVNLVGLRISDRPGFFLSLVPHLQELHSRTGRPHWLVIDETHHLQPPAWEPAALAQSQALTGTVRITISPRLLSLAARDSLDTLIVVGPDPEILVSEFCEVVGRKPPQLPPAVEGADAVLWRWHDAEAPVRVRITPAKMERRRHSRKYAEGNLPPDRSFYFRGPEGKLKLRAQNLILFTQMADGVDDETWLHHLKAGEYSRWFREIIKDDNLASEAEAIEEDQNLSAAESRTRIREAVERHYTLPASPPLPMPGTDAENVAAPS